MTEKIDVKIGTPEEQFWTEIKKKTMTTIEQCKHEIEIQEWLLKKAESRIKEEQAK